MLRFKNLLFVLFIASTLHFIGCDFQQAPNGESQVILDFTTLNLEGGGTEIPIYYSVENGVKGRLPKVTSNVDWIRVKSVTSYAINIIVDPSDVDEERYGFLTINYEGMPKPVYVHIVQDKQLLNKFRFELVSVDKVSCAVKYTPVENGRPFMANIIDVEYFRQSGITDLNEFIYKEMENYIATAGRYNLTLEELLMERVSPKLIYTDEVVRQYTSMRPGGVYLAYAYGVTLKNNSYTVTTPMHYFVVEIPTAGMYNVSFNISGYNGGSSAEVSIDPKSWSGYYTVQIVPDSSIYYVPNGDVMSEGIINGLMNDFYNRARKAISNGASVEAFLNGSCYQGKKSLNVALSGGNSYMVVVYAVESVSGSIPVMCSVPTIYYL